MAVGEQRLAFRVGSRPFSLPLASVRRVGTPDSFARLPRQPVWLRGLANVGGEVVPVLDLAVWLRLPAAALLAGRLLVVEIAGERLALLVDEVLGIAGIGQSGEGAADGGEPWPGEPAGPFDLAGLVERLEAELPALTPRQAS